MSKPERIDVNELKQPDQFHEGVEHGVVWIQEHARKVLWAIGGVVAAVVLYAGWSAWDSRREQVGAAALGKALEVLEAPIVDAAVAKPTDADDPSFGDEASRAASAKTKLEAVRSSYGGTEAGTLALVHLGRIAADAGELDAARGHWEAFAKKADGHIALAAVRLSLLRLDREQGKADQALAYLEKATAAGSETSELPADIAIYELAATYEALDRADEARTAYQRLVDEHPDSAWTQMARQRLNVLGPAASTPVASAA